MPLTATGGSIALAALLPSGVDLYIALYQDEECTVELEVEGYERVAYTGWSTALDGWARINTNPVTWSEWPNGGAFRGVAICDAPSEGNQLATSPPKDGTVFVDPGDYPEIDAGGLIVEVG